MSRKILLILFISCSIHAIAQTDYYYYQGNKIPLTLNENKVVVSIPKECDTVRERIQTNVQALDSIKDEAFEILVLARTEFEKLTTLDFWEEDAKSVIITPSYFTQHNEEIYLTPYLNVELKKEEDIDLLSAYAEKYRLKIVRNSPLIPLWYILHVTPESEKSPLVCANELWESGVFAATAPDWEPYYILDDAVHSITTPIKGASQGIYNLQGRRLKSVPIKGIYIQNGRKQISH